MTVENVKKSEQVIDIDGIGFFYGNGIHESHSGPSRRTSGMSIRPNIN